MELKLHAFLISTPDEGEQSDFFGRLSREEIAHVAFGSQLRY
jgi:hypothetical protein